MRTAVNWVIDYYSPIPIIKTDSSDSKVLSEDLFFVVAHDNQYDLLYGDYQNTLPIRYLLCVRPNSEIATASPKINLTNFNINYTNADVKCIYGVCDTALGHDNFLSILDAGSNYNKTQNNINLVNTNESISFGSWSTNKVYQILDFTNLDASQKVYTKSTGSLYSGFNAIGKLVYNGPDDAKVSISNTRPVIRPTSTYVNSNISFNIELNSETYRCANNIFSANIEFDIPIPVLSGIPYIPSGEAYNQGSERGFQLYSNTASNIWKYQFADASGQLSGWKTIVPKNPNIRYSTSTDVTYVTEINYDCYAINTGFKGATKSTSKGTSNYERSLYFTQFVLDIDSNNSPYIRINLGSNISSDISNMYVQLKEQSSNGSWTLLVNNEAKMDSFGSWNVQFSNIGISTNLKYKFYAYIISKSSGAIYSSIESDAFDLRSIYFSEKVNYSNQITNEPYGQLSQGTTIALGLVDKKCYVSGTSDIATTFDWQLQLNSLAYGSPNTLYPYQHLWINTRNSYRAKAQRTNADALWNKAVWYSNRFTVDTIQPSIHLSNLQVSGAAVSFTATAKYGHDNGTQQEYACKNWQYALVEKSDTLKGIRQTILYHGVDAKTAKDNNYSGAVGNYDRLTGPYYIIYTNEDIDWVDIPDSTGNSSVTYTANGAPNKDYILLVRATRELNNLPCNMYPQFDSSTIDNGLVTPNYVIHTQGGVGIYMGSDTQKKWKLAVPYIRIVPDKNIPGNEDKDPYWAPATAYIYTESNNKWNPIIWDGTIPPAEKISADTSPQTVILDDSSEAAVKDAHSASADTFINIDSISDISSKGTKSIESENSIDIITQTIAFSRLKAGIESSINIPMISTVDIYSRAVKEVTYKTELILSYTIDSKSADAKQLEQAADSKTLELFDTSSLSSADTEHSESNDNNIYIADTSEGINCDSNHLTSDVDTNILSNADPITISDLTYTSGNIDVPIETNTDIVADDSSQADSSDIFDIDAKCEVMVIQGGYLEPEIDGNDLKIKSVMTISQEDDMLTLE